MREEEKQALIGLCRIEIKRWKSIADRQRGGFMVELMEIALASLTAEPVGWRYRYLMPHMKNVDGTMGWVGNWKLTDDISCLNKSKGYEIEDLFTTPPLPAVPDGWIKCSDRMPEVDSEVIYYFVHTGIGFGYYKGHNTFVSTEGLGFLCGDVTHWMPMPEPPEVP